MGATWRCCSDSSAPDSRSSISPTMPIRARWKAEECWKSRLCQRRCCAKFMTLLAALTNLQPCGRGDEARHHKFWAGARVLPDKSRKMYTAKPNISWGPLFKLALDTISSPHTVGDVEPCTTVDCANPVEQNRHQQRAGCF